MDTLPEDIYVSFIDKQVKKNVFYAKLLLFFSFSSYSILSEKGWISYTIGFETKKRSESVCTAFSSIFFEKSQKTYYAYSKNGFDFLARVALI